MPVVEHHGGKRDVEVWKKWRAQCNGHMGAQWGESGKMGSGEDVGEQISGQQAIGRPLNLNEKSLLLKRKWKVKK